MSYHVVIFLFLSPIILNCKNYLVKVQNDYETTSDIPKNEIEAASNEKIPVSGSDYFQGPLDFASKKRKRKRGKDRKKVKKGKIERRMLWRVR